ncbi:hypothetical protein RRG08_051109 [Elysia crispata]|uniref:Uncharacterized protein n=1 Tax=Elysia crispata TaxID=231223 RepID=A0AAE1AI94_9GAST|nr:hypothetical protein RRG08_051109 [Elysia crispata]
MSTAVVDREDSDMNIDSWDPSQAGVDTSRLPLGLHRHVNSCCRSRGLRYEHRQLGPESSWCRYLSLTTRSTQTCQQLL